MSSRSATRSAATPRHSAKREGGRFRARLDSARGVHNRSRRSAFNARDWASPEVSASSASPSGLAATRSTTLRFIDTNVPLYTISRDPAEQDKAKRASDILADRARGPVHHGAPPAGPVRVPGVMTAAHTAAMLLPKRQIPPGTGRYDLLCPSMSAMNAACLGCRIVNGELDDAFMPATTTGKEEGCSRLQAMIPPRSGATGYGLGSGPAVWDGSTWPPHRAGDRSH